MVQKREKALKQSDFSADKIASRSKSKEVIHDKIVTGLSVVYGESRGRRYARLCIRVDVKADGKRQKRCESLVTVYEGDDETKLNLDMYREKARDFVKTEKARPEALKVAVLDRKISDFIPEFLKDPDLREKTLYSRSGVFRRITAAGADFDIPVGLVDYDYLLGLVKLLNKEDLKKHTVKSQAGIILNFFSGIALEMGTEGKSLLGDVLALREYVNKKMLKNRCAVTHRKSIESNDNKELQEHMILCMVSALDDQYFGQMVSCLLIPCRISEVRRISPADITSDNAHIEYTKTISAKDGGFNVPLTKKVSAHLKTYPVTITPEYMNIKMKKYFGCHTHGIRSTFKDYLCRRDHDYAVIEACLSHVVGGIVQRSYGNDQKNYYYSKRRAVMADWYDFIFGCIDEARARAGSENVLSMEA